jgi:hypothetical protein|tara:strand:- start:220 stop:522 length:303 start_codon:yes stop_codon:yes gene_type:complete
MKINEFENEINSLLSEAKDILVDRHVRHGDSTIVHSKIASLMTSYKNRITDTDDVFAHNILTKMVRVKNGNHHREHLVDVIGYAVLWYLDLNQRKKKNDT